MRFIVVLCSLFFAGLLHAEEVTSPSSPDAAKHEFSGKIELGGFKTSGNSETETFDGKLEAFYGYDLWSLDFVFSGTQTSEGGALTSDFYDSELKLKYALDYHAYAFVLLGYREDSFSGIYSEKKNIAGFGYHAFEDDATLSVDMEIGYGERVSKKVDRIRMDYDPGTHIAVLSKYMFSEDDMLKANVVMETGNDDDYIKKELAWEHHLFGNLDVNFGYESRTLTKPELGKQRTDSKMTVKLGYKF